MKIATASAVDLDQALGELRAALGSPGLVLVFHGESYRTAVLAESLAAAFPDSMTVGCRARGVLGSQASDGIVAVAIEEPARASLMPVADLRQWHFEDARQLLAQLRRPLRRGLGEDLLLITLSEGIHGAEERLIASLASHAPQVSLVGGSASTSHFGDRGTVFANGQVLEGGAVVLLLEPNRPFKAFATHHFREAEGRVVVTATRPDEHWLDELDGRPAVEVFEELCGWSPGSLAADPELPQKEGLHLGFRASGRLHIRAVLGSQGASLLLGGAVTEGMVLRLVRAGDLVASTIEGLDFAAEQVQTPDSMLLFSCIGRLHEARFRSCESEYLAAQARYPMAGFFCGGEHHGALLENFTVSGVVFGAMDA